MRPFAIVAGFAFALLLTPLAAAADDGMPEDILAESRSDDADPPAAALRRLGLSSPATLEDLARILRSTPPDAKARERRWRDALLVLAKLAETETLPPELVDRIRALSRTRPTVMKRAQRERYAEAQYRFDYAARRVLHVVDRAAARRELFTQTATLDPAARVAVYSGIAWRSAADPSDAAGVRRAAARDLLLDLGPEGVAAAIAAIPDSDEATVREMAQFFDTLSRRGREEEAVAAFIALTDSPHESGNRLAFDSLGLLRSSGVAGALMERIRALDPGDALRFRLGFGAIEQLGQPDAVPFLVDYLDHPNRQVAAAAALTIARREEAGLRALDAALASPRPEVRESVRSAAREGPQELRFLVAILHPLEGAAPAEAVRRSQWDALRALVAAPDERSAVALTILAERTGSERDVAAREKTWAWIARALDALTQSGRFRTLTAELVAFLRQIAETEPESAPKPPYREYARSALFEISVHDARQRLIAEIAGKPHEPAMQHIAEAAWAGDGCHDLRCLAARRHLADASGGALAPSRPWLREATVATRIEMVEWLRSEYPSDREGVGSALLELAIAEEEPVSESAHAALRHLRPPGTPAALIGSLERERQPARLVRDLETLGVLGNQSAVGAVARHARAADETVSLGAVRALARLGERGEAALAEALPVLSGEAQREAALALANAKARGAQEAVLSIAAKTRDAELRRTLLNALAEGKRMAFCQTGRCALW